jgi:hypothetical protein
LYGETRQKEAKKCVNRRCKNCKRTNTGLISKAFFLIVSLLKKKTKSTGTKHQLPVDPIMWNWVKAEEEKPHLL